jgi:hypothetical protein
MPDKRGPDTYKGFESPNTDGWPEPIRQEVKHVYGSYRVKHPQESQKVKSRGAQIAWTAARKKYPKEYREHRAASRKNKAKMGGSGKKTNENLISNSGLQRARENYISKE